MERPLNNIHRQHAAGQALAFEMPRTKHALQLRFLQLQRIAVIIFTAANLGLKIRSTKLRALLQALGSGILEVKAYLNGVDAPAIFSFRSLVIKIVGSIADVSSLNVGKSGHMVHTDACITTMTSGIVFAFHARVVGALFALEEMASW
ncbi:putative chloride channel-like protein CLC-g [Tanacetum coccineum]